MLVPCLLCELAASGGIAVSTNGSGADAEKLGYLHLGVSLGEKVVYRGSSLTLAEMLPAPGHIFDTAGEWAVEARGMELTAGVSVARFFGKQGPPGFWGAAPGLQIRAVVVFGFQGAKELL